MYGLYIFQNGQKGSRQDPKDTALDVRYDSETNHHKWGGLMVEDGLSTVKKTFDKFQRLACVCITGGDEI